MKLRAIFIVKKEKTMKELPKTYEPRDVEDRLYKFWVDNGYFHAERDPDKKPFTIVMPPPNVTGQLHMGHAMDAAMQDVLIRFKRMQGYSALWIPGVDHAGIATQIRVEEELRKEGKTRYDLGREKFLERVWAWKHQYGDRIVEQQKRLGASCDWDRARFTMDEGCSKAVREVFVNLYEQGLIYKGSRIINWCPHCVTALSDAEVEYVDKPGHLWHVRYPLADGSGEVIIATTRPETMLGDSGVCVNPNDERYKDIVGKNVILPLVGKEIPVVADDYAEMDFGTGCVKMTPAHDPNDFEVGLRHNLEVIRVLDDKGVVNENGGKYQGLDRYEARKQIVADLEAQGYLVKVEPYNHNVGTCYRCHRDVEPIISAQWFVKMKPLAEEALRVVNDGETKFVPERFTKIYTNWMENVRDWCISRQLWWGHQIPAWYCDDCGETVVAKSAPCACPKCDSAKLTQDPDTLDTWFSSALWPFSTLGWPNEDSADLKYFYPTNTLVTGYDIIGFWVSRMIFSGLAYTGKAPFDTVCIHGIVRDSQGRKMSKSLGNGIDPLEVIDQYGADALRLMLIIGSTAGNDMRYSDEKVLAARNFANKLWNASRFVQMNLPEDFQPGLPAEEQLDMSDKWVLSELAKMAADATANLDKYELGLAAEKVENFIWEVYCDWYIEICKTRLNGDDAQAADTARKVLVYVLDRALKLLHPFMPFITEEIYQALPGSGETIMTQLWPGNENMKIWAEDCADFEKLMDYIKAVRTMRAEMNVHPAKKTSMVIETASPAAFEKGGAYLARFAFATDVTVTPKYEGSADGMVNVATPDAKGFIPMMELIDREKELARLNKELTKAEKELGMFTNQLNNPKFVEKAPAKLVEETRAKLAAAQEKTAKIKESIAALG